MRSNPAHELFFIFQVENILRSDLNFSTFYGDLIDFKSLLGLSLVSLIWLGKKISLKYLFLGGRALIPMSRRCGHRLCPNWLRILKLTKFHSPSYLLQIDWYQLLEFSYRLLLFLGTEFGKPIWAQTSAVQYSQLFWIKQYTSQEMG